MKLFKFYAKMWKDFWRPANIFDTIYAAQVLTITFVGLVFIIGVIGILLIHGN